MGENPVEEEDKAYPRHGTDKYSPTLTQMTINKMGVLEMWTTRTFEKRLPNKWIWGASHKLAIEVPREA